ncbi:hypothetical protein J4441_01735 [Candidatus Micrarchaeota archaeon]|nr:hypothetical protein [Candidatus Micrarchaeota archaeon]
MSAPLVAIAGSNAPAAQRINISFIVSVGSRNEHTAMRNALGRLDIPIYEVAPNASKDPQANKSIVLSNVREQLAKGFTQQSWKNGFPLVVCDVLDSVEGITFADVAQKSKAESPDSVFCLLTSESECAGTLAQMEEYARSRGIGAELLKSVDFTLNYSGDRSIFPAMVRAVEDGQNYTVDSRQIILLAEEKPLIYSPILCELHAACAEQRAGIVLVRSLEEALATVNQHAGRIAGSIAGAGISEELLTRMQEASPNAKKVALEHPGLPANSRADFNLVVAESDLSLGNKIRNMAGELITSIFQR